MIRMVPQLDCFVTYQANTILKIQHLQMLAQKDLKPKILPVPEKLNMKIRESQGVDDENKEQTIVSTSVEAERTFSAAGLFITKIRSNI